MPTKNTIKLLTFNVILEQEEDEGYAVSVPALPGCFSQGDTFEEALNNVKEAINLYLEKVPKEEVNYFGHRAEREFVVPVKLEYA